MFCNASVLSLAADISLPAGPHCTPDSPTKVPGCPQLQCWGLHYKYDWLAVPTENPYGRHASSPPVQEAAAARLFDHTNGCPHPTPVRIAARHQTHPPRFPKGLPEPMGLQCMTCWFEAGGELLRKGNGMLVKEDEMSGIHNICIYIYIYSCTYKICVSILYMHNKHKVKGCMIPVKTYNILNYNTNYC